VKFTHSHGKHGTLKAASHPKGRGVERILIRGKYNSTKIIS
jgi:hypothetical protein